MKFEKGDFWKYISLSVLGMIGSLLPVRMIIKIDPVQALN